MSANEPIYYTYPAVFSYDNDGISIEFPDLPGCLSCAHTSEDAFKRAKEALGLHLFGLEQEDIPIPVPSHVQDLHPEAGMTVTMIDVYMPSIRQAAVNGSVICTVTLPAWMIASATERNIDLSQILREALNKLLQA